MAISDRINEMYTHVGDVYDTITNVDVNNGKNLFDYNKITTSAYYTNNYDGSFTRNSNGSNVLINVNDASVPYDAFSLLAGTYSVSFDIKTTATATLTNFFMCTRQNGTTANLSKSIGVQIPANTTTHIKAENYVVVNNAEKVGFAGYLNASTGVVISNIQVEKGTTASEYQPYTDNPTYKNVENIPSTIRKSYLDIMNNGIDKIWNNWEKVEGTGESLSLNSTEEAPMKINLKGNTSQETTTQSKNLANPNDIRTGYPQGNIGSTVTIATSANSITYYKCCYVEANQQYTLSWNPNTPKATGLREVFLVDSDSIILAKKSYNNSNGVRTTTFTFTSSGWVYASLDTNATEVQIEKGSTATDYVEFVPNSPSPDYPQDIHVVSGDNYINVVGKNLMDNKAISGVQNGVAYTINQDKSITLNGTSTQAFIFDIDNGRTLEAGTYTLSLKGKILGCGIYLYENNTLKAYVSSNWTNDKNTFTLDKKTTFNEIRIDVQVNKTFNNITIYPMIEKGNQATTYEAYKGASYPINLPVENLINSSLFTISGSYNVSSISNGEVVGTSITGYAGVRIALGQNVSLKTNDVIYVRLKIKSDVAGDIFNTIQLFNSSNTVITDNSTKILTPTLTTEYQEYIMKYTLETDETLNKLFIQHKGSSSNVFTIKDIQVSYVNGSYTPYGTTPIELCKIGNYQDSIKKSTGKNLFESVVYKDSYIVASDGTEAGNALGCIWKKIKVKPNTIYTLSYTSTDYTFSQRISEYNSSNTFIQRNPTNTSPYTFTTTSTTEYINVSGLKTDTNIMIEEGSTATSYEPYGKVWYLNKQIGKYTITGQESATQYYWSSEINGIKFVLDDAIKTVANVPTYCNRFNQWYSGTTANNYVRLNRTTSYLGFWFGNITIEGVNSITTFKSYATNNQILLYYPLATPTYTEITDSTLLSQLEAINGARSYENQTNISQENNDLPFILDVTALKELTQ